MTAPAWANPKTVAGRAAEPVIELWDRLVAPRGPRGQVDTASLEALPDAGRRWLKHAIAHGTPAASAVLLQMTGRIKVRRWLPFQAVQVISPEGFVWVARAGWRALSIMGFDHYVHGEGEMRWLLAGRAPLLSDSGPDTSRSAAGRLATEATLWVPTSFTGVDWHAGDDPDTAVATWHIGAEESTVELHLDDEGRPRAVSMQRWGNPNGEPFSFYPFGGKLEDEATFGGFTIPTAVRVGWWWGTDRWGEGEFFRARITDAAFL